MQKIKSFLKKNKTNITRLLGCILLQILGIDAFFETIQVYKDQEIYAYLEQECKTMYDYSNTCAGFLMVISIASLTTATYMIIKSIKYYIKQRKELNKQC